jgi:hypothetical protein
VSTTAHLAIYQGDDYAAIVTVSDGKTPPDQVIVGYSAKAQIRANVADSDPTVIVEIATSVTSPYVYLSIPNAQTVKLTGRYVWDLQIVDSTGMITTILNGYAVITQEVTR